MALKEIEVAAAASFLEYASWVFIISSLKRQLLFFLTIHPPKSEQKGTEVQHKVSLLIKDPSKKAKNNMDMKKKCLILHNRPAAEGRAVLFF